MSSNMVKNALSGPIIAAWGKTDDHVSSGSAGPRAVCTTRGGCAVCVSQKPWDRGTATHR
eukprot:3359234-Prymnesium_polylepis.1